MGTTSRNCDKARVLLTSRTATRLTPLFPVLLSPQGSRHNPCTDPTCPVSCTIVFGFYSCCLRATAASNESLREKAISSGLPNRELETDRNQDYGSLVDCEPPERKFTTSAVSKGDIVIGYFNFLSFAPPCNISSDFLGLQWGWWRISSG